MKRVRLFQVVTCLLLLFVSSNAFTATLEQAQALEKFQSLPADVQEKLKQQALSDQGRAYEDISTQVPQSRAGVSVPKAIDELSSVGAGAELVASSSAAPAKGTSALETQFRAHFQSRFAKDLSQFGYNLFSSSSTAVPQVVVPGEEYIVTPGDQLRIRLWGASVDTEYVAVVEADGTLNLPKVGVVSVAGEQLGQLEGKIKNEALKYMQGINISLVLEQLHSVEVYVIGEVANPGLHVVPAFSSLFKGLQAAGGVNKTGTLRKIKLYRSGKLVTDFDLYDFVFKGNRDGDKVLRNQDVIFIPSLGDVVAVAGAVQQPAIYEMSAEKSFAQFVAYAGGYLPNASTLSLYIKRYQADQEFQVFAVQVPSEVPVLAGDLLEIPFAPETKARVVTLEGHVKLPRVFSYTKGMTLADVLVDAAGLKPEALTAYALLHRFNEQTTRYEVQKIPLQQRFDGSYNLPLLPYDRIEILSRKELGIKETVTIAGAVWRPATYAFTPGLAAADLIAMAGGLKDHELIKGSAYLYRYDPEILQYGMQRLDLEQILHAGSNLLLQPFDKIELLSRKDYDFDQKVQIVGAVRKPGEYLWRKSMSARDLIDMAGGLKENEYIKGSAYLYRYDPEILQYGMQRLDLEQILHAGSNLLLQPLDKIELLSRKDYDFEEKVRISGAVRKPGEYVWRKSMSASDLIDLAGGAVFGAQLDLVEVTQVVIQQGDSTTQHLSIDLQKQPEFQLQPYDFVMVPRVAKATQIPTVNIEGEVLFPGRYSIQKGERLSDVIRRAGGFSDKAYFFGAHFASQHAQQIQQRNIDKMISRLQLDAQRAVADAGQSAASQEGVNAAELSGAAAGNLIAELKKIKADGRITLRLGPLNDFSKTAHDFELQDGDRLYVPQKPSFVAVVGSVYSPNSFVYEPNMTIGDYLKLSGGPTKEADEDHIYVQKSNGEVVSAQQKGLFSSFYGQELMPGDTVVVLEDFDRVPALRLFKDLTEIVFRIATTAGIAFAI